MLNTTELQRNGSHCHETETEIVVTLLEIVTHPSHRRRTCVLAFSKEYEIGQKFPEQGDIIVRLCIRRFCNLVSHLIEQKIRHMKLFFVQFSIVSYYQLMLSIGRSDIDYA